MTRGRAPDEHQPMSSEPEVRLSTRWEAFVLGLTFLAIANIAIIAARYPEYRPITSTMKARWWLLAVSRRRSPPPRWC